MVDQERAKALLMRRTEGFSIWRIVRQSALQYTFRILAAITFLAGALNGKDVQTKLFFMTAFGACCGALSSDAGLLRRMIKDWGFNERIIDWNKVEAISGDNDSEDEALSGPSRRIAQTSQTVADGSASILPGDLSLKQCLVAGMGFFPLLGLPFALLAIAWGLSIQK